MASVNELLDDLLEILNRSFDAKYFRARVITLDSFEYLNDEEVDKMDEIEDDETVIISRWDETSVEKFLESDETVPLAAVDAASVKLGDTERGVISAIRLAMVVKDERGRMNITKIGPYVFHITEDNKDSVYDYFRSYFDLGSASAPKLNKMTDRIRNFLERMAQRVLCEGMRDSIILWDGSLTGGTVDTPLSILRDTLRIAESNGNAVVGISKTSWLKTQDGNKVITLLDNVEGDGYLNINRLLTNQSKSRILGDVFVVKFTPDGFSFRVDIHPAPGRESTEILNVLRSNCTFYNGYPDMLRIAHINAYFVPSEILALQSYVADKFNLIFVRPFDVRKHILAPFG